MRNFNNEDLDKYEKITKKAVQKFKNKVNFSPKMPSVKVSTIAGAFITSGLAFLAYRIYDYRKYRAQRYVDFFQWKQAIASKVLREDLIDKVTQFDLSNQSMATERYEKYLRQDFERMVEKIREQKSYKFQQRKSRFQANQNSRNKKNEDRNNTRELILSKSGKAKLDFGYMLKLHTKQYLTTLTNNAQIIKKTFISPVTLFNVPIYATKKKQVKKVSGKMKLGDLVPAKAKFDLSSQCEKINYWNLFVVSNFDNKTTKKQMPETASQTEGVSQSTSLSSSHESTKMSRQEILFQCRKRVKLVEEAFLQQVKHAINQSWMKEEEESF